jgi:subtilisin family serine protease
MPHPALSRSSLLALPTTLLALTLALTNVPSRAPFVPVGGAEGQEEGKPAARRSESAPSAPRAALSKTGPLLQRALARVGADRGHAAGQNGRGLTVAILDGGFHGYREHLGKALPAEVRVKTFRADGNFEARESQHGILCAEVVHALAPQARIVMANWEPDRPETFLAAVRWAKDQGANVMTCSVISPSWSDCEGGGPIHTELARLLGDGRHRGDVLFFASAGNTAQRHWSGPFRAGKGGYHAWGADGAIDNPLTPWGTEDRVSVELCWTDRAVAFEASVTDATTGQPVANEWSGRSQPVGGCSCVRFAPVPGHDYRVRVRETQGTGGAFHLVSLGGNLERSSVAGSITFPADGPEVIAVGAVDEDGHRASYSSCGPNSKQPKPDLVAPVPFPSSWRGKSFSGTSAASPQAAAVAALCWSGHPDWTAAQVRSALCGSARDLGPKGHDCETGYGLVTLPGVAGPAVTMR